MQDEESIVCKRENTTSLRQARTFIALQPARQRNQSFSQSFSYLSLLYESRIGGQIWLALERCLSSGVSDRWKGQRENCETSLPVSMIAWKDYQLQEAFPSANYPGR